jgi:hypothetical protein
MAATLRLFRAGAAAAGSLHEPVGGLKRRKSNGSDDTLSSDTKDISPIAAFALPSLGAIAVCIEARLSAFTAVMKRIEGPPLFTGKNARNELKKRLSHNKSHNKFADFHLCLSLCANVSKTHAYEVRPRKDHRGVNLISEALPFGRLWYGGPEAVSGAIDYAKHRSCSHNALIRVCHDSRNVIIPKTRRQFPNTEQGYGCL